MSADLCPECKGTDHNICSYCMGKRRRRPELHEWDALKVDCDWLDALLRRGLRAWRKCRKERDHYREALEQIAEAGPEYAKRSYSLVAIARAALGGEKPPLECHLCGARRWNDESVRWIDGNPFCADWCADRGR